MSPRWFGESRRTGFGKQLPKPEDPVKKCVLGDTQQQRANSPCSPEIVVDLASPSEVTISHHPLLRRGFAFLGAYFSAKK